MLTDRFTVIGRSFPQLVHRSRKVLASILLIATLLVSACSSPAGGGATTGVQWGDYAADLQSRIDGEAAARDCTTLQAEFDAADANNAATMGRTGHNNAKLMVYIDTAMRGAGCY